ncbi:MAG: response regulator [Desulfatibacillaceae bacterium]|nr:response regulator [Desulfatibacillaceae bacterium]
MAQIGILIIDDDPAVHELLTQYLTLSHYRVFDAYDGNSGIRMVEEIHPDLVLLDVQMPGMDGFATLLAIREKAQLSDIPILFLTSLDRQHLKVKGLELGADDYITKPFNSSELLARIKAALRRTARYRRTEGIMAGNLSDISLADLLQSMEMGAKTATVKLPEMDGVIYLSQGRFVHARQGRFTGEEALVRIFLLEKGSFTTRFNELPANIGGQPQPLMGLLMNVLAAKDEIMEIIAKVAQKAPYIKIEEMASGLALPQNMELPGVFPLKDLVAAMEGSLKANLKAVVDAVKSGQVKVVHQAG